MDQAALARMFAGLTLERQESAESQALAALADARLGSQNP